MDTTIKGLGLMLAGAGINEIRVDWNHGLIMIGLGVFMVVLIAVMQKYGFPIGKSQ